MNADNQSSPVKSEAKAEIFLTNEYSNTNGNLFEEKSE